MKKIFFLVLLIILITTGLFLWQVWQNKDGSWDDLHPILHLGNNKVFAYTSMLPKIQIIKADFHTTAQAIWLLSLLLEESGSDLI